MNIEEFQKQSLRTLLASGDTLTDNIHMVLGMITESSEIADVYKKKIAYQKDIDEINVKEEIGDLLHYVVNFCSINNWDLATIMQNNVDKLKIRYPEKFTEENALNRDLESERRELSK